MRKPDAVRLKGGKQRKVSYECHGKGDRKVQPPFKNIDGTVSKGAAIPSLFLIH
jgi:hypothetical protein